MGVSFVCFSQTHKKIAGMTAAIENFETFKLNKRDSDLSIWKNQNGLEFYNHPEFGLLPDDSPCSNCIELLDRRTISSRYFIDKDDTAHFYLQQANMPIHFSEDGFLLSLSNKLAPLSLNEFELTNGLNPISINTEEGFVKMLCDGKPIYFNNLSLSIETTDDSLAFAGKANWDDYSAGDDGIYVRNFFAGIDAKFQVFQGAIKSSFIIKENKFGEFVALRIRDELCYLDDVVLVSFEESYFSNRGHGAVLANHAGQSLVRYSPAIAYTENENNQNFKSLEYLLDSSSISIRVPFDLINLSEGPLVVDPLVSGTNTLQQAAIIGSQYNASCNFDNSCDYSLTVPLPANATFTDILFNFDYQALGFCGRSDGATRIRTGSCVSPSQLNFFWFCNLITQGLCQGINISLFDDLGNCLPPPSCISQDLEFVLEFYRSCSGSFGCSNDCIASASAFSIAVEGFTLQPQNPANPIIVSDFIICEGESITASVQAAFGVPPYTYNWSFAPSGVPSIGSNSSITVSPEDGIYTFYQTVEDACNNEIISTRQFQVIDQPEPSIIGNLIYCQGTPLSLSTEAYTSYSWSSGGNAQSASVTEANNPITVTVTNSNGCEGTSDPVNVEELETIAFANTINICSGESVLIHGNQTSVSGVYEETFSVNGCDSIATITLVVNDIPVVSANATVPIVCAGEETVISASGADQYSWNQGIGNGQSHTVLPFSTTTYTVEGTNISGCSATSQVTVTVNSLTPPPPESISICDGEDYLLPNGQTVSETGTYTSDFFTNNGCDSSIVTELTISPSFLINEDISICGNEGFTLADGTVVFTSGLYPIATITTQGCDSIVNTNLEVNLSYNEEIDAQICNGQQYLMPDGSEEGSTGIYSFNLQTINGCDSIITINLEVQNLAVNEENVSICDNESYTLPDGDSVSEPGQYETTTNNGICDSNTITNLEVNPTYQFLVSESICSGQTFLLPDGNEVMSPGLYSVNYTSILGCDSIYTIQLDTIQVFEIINPISICSGESYILEDGTSISESGLYPTTYTSLNGCDSIAIIDLTVDPFYNINLIWQVCEADNPLDPIGNPIAASGDFVYELSSIHGCDSIINLSVNLGSGSLQDEFLGICRGESFVTPGGQLINGEGEFQDVYMDVSGCDSVINYTVSFLTSPIASFSASPASGNLYLAPTNFQNESIQADSAVWSISNWGSYFEDSPIVDFKDLPGKYNVCLEVWNENGCYDKSCQEYIIEDYGTAYIPSAFTPNNDGLNDFFFIQGDNINPERFELQVYNRWGEVVFETTNPEEKWDGSIPNSDFYANDNIFVYRALITWTSNNDIKEFKGKVMLIK